METSAIIDLETLDTAPTAVVTQIGCIIVERGTFLVRDEFSLHLPILPQLAAGRTFSADTIAWHLSKKNHILSTGGTDPRNAFHALHLLLDTHKPRNTWAWGKDFERPILENIYRHHDIPLTPYAFRSFHCGRDAWHLAFDDAKPPERTHDAIKDCFDELRDIKNALHELGIPGRF